MSGPVRYGIALFPGFEALDAFGPLSIINQLSRVVPIELSIIADKAGAVSTNVNASDPGASESVMATHTFANAPDLDVLIVPGGQGTRNDSLTASTVGFIKDRFPKTKYLLTVCTGAALAARAGVLDGKNATSNKLAFKWVSQAETV